MFPNVIASQLITPPAIWGKLPGHADFVRSHMRHGESEGWRPWLAEQGRLSAATDETGAGAVLPATFVLPPGTVSFAPRRFVVGVIAPSSDRLGRQHALLVYQLAHPRWIAQHFALQAEQPNDWFFWLARAVGRHIGLLDAADIRTLERTVAALWTLHAPGWLALSPFTHGTGPLSPPAERVQMLLDRMAGPAPQNDLGAHLWGVRHLPWADWPQRLQREPAESAFWQQDAGGGYVNAANRLDTLWGGLS